MLKKLTPILALVGAIAIISLAIYGFAKKDDVLGTFYQDPDNLAGSSSLLCRMPNVYVLDSATTTNSAVDGCEVTQQIQTGDIEMFNLNLVGKAGTATSTLSIKQQLSQDGTNWYDISQATTTEGLVGTTTITVIPTVTSMDLGIATTTISRQFKTYGANFTRLLFLGEDLADDPDDGVRTWLTITKYKTVN